MMTMMTMMIFDDNANYDNDQEELRASLKDIIDHRDNHDDDYDNYDDDEEKEDDGDENEGLQMKGDCFGESFQLVSKALMFQK